MVIDKNVSNDLIVLVKFQRNTQFCKLFNNNEKRSKQNENYFTQVHGGCTRNHVIFSCEDLVSQMVAVYKN